MTRREKASRFSLAAQGVGYRAYVVFFLASVVPLALLAFVAEEHVFPHLDRDALPSLTVAMLLVVGLAFLAYLVLGAAMREALAEIRGHNERLRILLDASGAFNQTAFGDVLRRQALAAAGGLVSASTAYFFRPRGAAGAVAPAEKWGTRDDLAGESEGLARLAAEATDSGRPKLASDARTGAHGLAVPVQGGDEKFGALGLLREGSAGAFQPAEVDALSALSQQAAVALLNVSLREAQKNFFTHVTQFLVAGLDLHMSSQVGHSKRVAYYSNLLGHDAGFDEVRLGRLYFAALLHDIGMLRLPRPSLVGANEADFRDHAALGGEMLGPVTLWSDIAPFIRHHHERWDGAGYPDGLSADRIPLESRIIGLAEAFDVMTHPNSYRSRMPLEDAVREVERCAGVQFDPGLVQALVGLVRRGEVQLE